MSAFEDHGGRIDAAMAAWPDAPRPWLDLSTGINPRPWQPPAGLSIDHHALPGRTDLRALEAAAAASFGVEPDAVVAVPGSEIALRLLATLGIVRDRDADGAGARSGAAATCAPASPVAPDDEPSCAGPDPAGAAALPRPWRRAVPRYATHDAALPGAADWRAGDPWPTGGTLLLANPGNPDGRVYPPAMLIAAHARLAAGGGWLVMDEAFADAVPGASVAPMLGGRDGAILFRSFGKMFGLAGVRLGFVIAPPGVVAAMRARLGDWPVSATAIAFGTAAYRDTPWLARTRSAVAAQACALDAVLARHGLIASGDCPLFRLVTGCDAGAVFARLAAAGILVRPFAGQPGWLRFGLPGDEAAHARLDRALG